ncbi:DedA family protein [Georgenia subflava]|uniref:DedA family protein n=1 Tax=Georgenia subflava TaxID=1622177 RepID=A0A6N7EFW9_9MICO|nr:VTT domain-containing protein [Georgenia subflava]MPV35848.1 DedA family protein [Georgenia subflava]
MPDLLTLLPAAFGPVLLIVGWLFAFAESALGVGMVLPGETVVLLVGAATIGPEQTVLAAAVVAVGASAGDHVGFLLGRRHGHRLRDSRPVRRVGTRHWDRATGLLRRRGPAAVVISRLLPVVRTLVPAAAGAADLGYRRFLAASALGAALWAALWVGAGAAAGSALPRVASAFGDAGWVLLAVAGAAVVATLLLRRRRVGVS